MKMPLMLMRNPTMNDAMNTRNHTETVIPLPYATGGRRTGCAVWRGEHGARRALGAGVIGRGGPTRARMRRLARAYGASTGSGASAATTRTAAAVWRAR